MLKPFPLTQIMADPEELDISKSQASDVFSLDFLALINESRMQYGLRQSDFGRYRQYCSRRLQRLRRVLDLTHSKSGKNFTPNNLTPTTLTDERHLHLLLYQTERAWAYGMELKSETAESGGDARKRYHLIRRLRKAQRYSNELSLLCKESGKVNARTSLDAKGYAAIMAGYLAFEEGQWQLALDKFVAARTIYEKLAGAGTLQQEALAHAAIDEIDPNIRFCAYKLRLSGDASGTGMKDVEDLVKDIRKQKKGTGLDLLETELEGVLAEARGQKVKEMSSITWRGRTVIPKNSDLAVAILKAQEAVSELEEHHSDSDEAQLESFDKLLAAWAEAEKIAKKFIKEDEEASQKVRSSKSAIATEELVFLHVYTIYTLHARTIQRNLLLITQIEKSSERKDQDLVRLYDDVLKHLETVKDVPGVSSVEGLTTDIEAKIAFYRAWRTIHLANAYESSRMLAEAYTLFEKAQTYASQMRATLLLTGKGSKDELLSVSNKDIGELEGRIRGGKCKVQAAWYLQEGGNANITAEELDEVPLIKKLDTFPTSLTTTSRAYPLLVDFPPMFEPIAARPLFFDVAFNHIDYPASLADRAGTKKASGEKSGIFGWFSKG